MTDANIDTTAAGGEGSATQDSGSNLRAGYVSASEMAERRGVTERTQSRERRLGIGPPYVRDGRQVFYRIEAYRAWLAEKEQATRRRARRGAERDRPGAP